MTKKKGENINVALNREKEAAKEVTGIAGKAEATDKNAGLSEREIKEKEEKERKKAEKKAEAERKKAEIKASMREIKKGNTGPKTEEAAAFEFASKFSYIPYSAVDAAAKYEGRMKVEIPVN